MHPLLMYVKCMDSPIQRDNCLLPSTIWQRLIERQTTEVLLVEILQREARVVLCVDGYHNDQRDHIYIPDRFAMELDMTEYVEVNVLDTMPPIATKIVLEPLDTDLDSYDLTNSASEYLSNWNVLKKNQILSVPCSDLGGYVMDVLVKDVEPEELVLLRGEVPFEIYRASDPIPTPTPSLPPPQTEEESFDDFLPAMPNTGKFQPFTGRGYRLGS